MASNDIITQANDSIRAGVSPLSGGNMLEMLIGLAVVVIVIFACAWVYKKVGGFDGSVGGVIKIIAGLSLGSRDRIALVEVGDKKILLGISPGRINTLHVFDASDDIAIAEQLDRPKPNGDFAGKLQALLNRDNLAGTKK